ncbi:hypothetical protein CYMTET_50692 [Cymbomonas tetramitiformis]|uniref:Uncharacterized protein n=1 Tax=Cymbomonas tetramitiformis TaxID=36881 RepID=A0AAE0EUH8_9CHLO|nr:hypothetical protein CYMTET_50692 [Cymbomonas tetramitiformis]
MQSAVFFVTYILIVNIMLVNVVIAVLLDKMVDCDDDEDEDEEMDDAFLLEQSMLMQHLNTEGEVVPELELPGTAGQSLESSPLRQDITPDGAPLMIVDTNALTDMHPITANYMPPKQTNKAGKGEKSTAMDLVMRILESKLEHLEITMSVCKNDVELIKEAGLLLRNKSHSPSALMNSSAAAEAEAEANPSRPPSEASSSSTPGEKESRRRQSSEQNSRADSLAPQGNSRRGLIGTDSAFVDELSWKQESVEYADTALSKPLGALEVKPGGLAVGLTAEKKSTEKERLETIKRETPMEDAESPSDSAYKRHLDGRFSSFVEPDEGSAPEPTANGVADEDSLAKLYDTMNDAPQASIKKD